MSVYNTPSSANYLIYGPCCCARCFPRNELGLARYAYVYKYQSQYMFHESTSTGTTSSDLWHAGASRGDKNRDKQHACGPGSPICKAVPSNLLPVCFPPRRECLSLHVPYLKNQHQ